MAWWQWLLLYLAFLAAFVVWWKRFWDWLKRSDHED